MGLALAGDKESPPSDQGDLFGASIDLTVDSAQASLPAHKVDHLSSGLKQVLSANSLTPAGAAMWRGRLGFAQSLMFGRMGRSLLRPFSARQYADGVSRTWAISDDLKEVSPWRIARLPNPTSRRVSVADQAPVLVYTDASGECHVGCIVFIDGVRPMAHTHVPDWMRSLLPGTFEYELRATIFGLAVATELATGRAVFLCCDNMGAIGTVVRGARRTRLGRTLVSVFWTIAATYGTTVWAEYVASKLNCSDAPSR